MTVKSLIKSFVDGGKSADAIKMSERAKESLDAVRAAKPEIESLWTPENQAKFMKSTEEKLMLGGKVDPDKAASAAKGLTKYLMSNNVKPDPSTKKFDMGAQIPFLKGMSAKGKWDTIAQVLAKHDKGDWWLPTLSSGDKNIGIMTVDEAEKYVVKKLGGTSINDFEKSYIDADAEYYLEGWLGHSSFGPIMETPGDMTLGLIQAAKQMGLKYVPVELPASKAPIVMAQDLINGIGYPSKSWTKADTIDSLKEYGLDLDSAEYLADELSYKELKNIIEDASYNGFTQEELIQAFKQEIPKTAAPSILDDISASFSIDNSKYANYQVAFHFDDTKFVDVSNGFAINPKASKDEAVKILTEFGFGGEQSAHIYDNIGPDILNQLMIAAYYDDVTVKKFVDTVMKESFSTYGTPSSKLKAAPPPVQTYKGPNDWRIPNELDYERVQFETPEDKELFDAMHFIRGTHHALSGRIENFRHIAQQYGLNDVDLGTINFYTRTGDGYLNKVLRGEEKPRDEIAHMFDPTVKRLNSSLDKLPNHSYKSLWRRSDLQSRTGEFIPDMYTEGEVTTELAFMSTTKNPIDRPYGSIRFIVKPLSSSKGKYIEDMSDYPGEGEVLYPAGSKFLVTKKEHLDPHNKYSGWDIYLEEIE